MLEKIIIIFIIMSWVILIIIATFLFSIGQIALKYDQSGSSFDTLLLFTLTMGVIAAIVFSLKHGMQTFPELFRQMLLRKWIVLAGLLFICGNGLWISSIRIAPNIGLVRAVMAGLETGLLLLAAFLIWNTPTTLMQFIGVILVLFGLLIIGIYDSQQTDS